VTDEHEQQLASLAANIARVDEKAKGAHGRLDTINGDLRSLQATVGELATNVANMRGRLTVVAAVATIVSPGIVAVVVFLITRGR